MKLIKALAFAGCIAFAPWARSAAIDPLVTFETSREFPTGWLQGSRAASTTNLVFSIAVRQPRADDFVQHAMSIATPGHLNYGNQMSYSQIKSFLRPSESTMEAISDWLTASGIGDKDITHEDDWIKFKATVEQIEGMLDTEFYYFNNDNDHVSIIRTTAYSLPISLHDKIYMIQPTTRFGSTSPQFNSIIGSEKAVTPPQAHGYDPVRCNTTITPDCIRGLYQLGNFAGNPSVGNSLGISGYLEQYASYSDLNLFAGTYAPYADVNNFTVVSINGGLNIQDESVDNSEANLDIQYAMAIAAGTPVIFYSTAGRGILIPDNDQPTQDDNQNEPYLDQLRFLLALPDDDLPSVLSTSYGEDEQSVPASYANVTCMLFAQLGARGVSIIFSSGDTGVGSACQTNDGKNTTRFLPNFPASCPFVTSVGGTTNVEPEVAVSFSSGGFSDLFPRPAYQEEAVCKYLDQLGDQWDGLYNRHGRGIPDVAAQSRSFYIFNQNFNTRISGTSCSAPVFASIIANMNSIRMSAGLPSLGFLNPFLYKYGVQGLTDIVDGGSLGCTGYDIFTLRKTPYVPWASWNATEGWDPVTGLGTPVFPKLVQLMFQYAVPGNSNGPAM